MQMHECLCVVVVIIVIVVVVAVVVVISPALCIGNSAGNSHVTTMETL